MLSGGTHEKAHGKANTCNCAGGCDDEFSR